MEEENVPWHRGLEGASAESTDRGRRRKDCTGTLLDHSSDRGADGHVYRSRSVFLKTKCERVVSHVFSNALNGNVSWPLSLARTTEVRRWETQILRLTFRPRMGAGGDWVEYRRR